MADFPLLLRASRRDIPRLAELWAHAFPGERTLEQRVRLLEAGGVYGGIEDAWYLCQGDRLAGALRLYSLTQYVRGTPFPMMGVAAVAVAASARRQGVGAELCRQALRLGRARGDVVSVLYPFRPAFYRRLGWGLAGSLHSLRFRPDALPASGSPTSVQLGDDGKARAAAAGCYARVAARSHGLIARSSRIWDQHLAAADRHLFVLPAANDSAAGYLLVSYGRNRRPAERTLIVHELVAESETAYHELLAWIGLQGDQWAVVRYDALPEEQLELVLSDPRPPRFRGARTLWVPVALRIRGPMIRVLDVPAALRAAVAWPAVARFAFTLRVRDPELPENEGPWRVRFDGASLHVDALAAGAAPAVDLEFAAAEFAQFWVGELRASNALRLGLARGSASSDTLAAVDALFRSERTLRLLDEF